MEVRVTSLSCDINYGPTESDLLLVAHIAGLGGKVVLKKSGKALWPWNGFEFDKKYSLVRTITQPIMPLERSQRKRKIATYAESDNGPKRRRASGRFLTRNTGSEGEGSIKQSLGRERERDLEQLETSSHHTSTTSEQQVAATKEESGAMAEGNEQLPLQLPLPAQEFRELSIRPSVRAWTTESEEHTLVNNHLTDNEGKSSNVKDDLEVLDIQNGSEDSTLIGDANTDSPSITGLSQAFKEDHTSFVFIDRATGDRRRRAFHVCTTLEDFFWFAQLTNTIAPGSYRSALAIAVDTEVKMVGQAKDEAGFQEMLEAVWKSQCWKLGDEVKCEVEVRELLLA